MDKLILNIQDVKEPDDFIRKLCQFIVLEGATANGVFRVDENPVNGEYDRAIPIFNNRPRIDLEGDYE
ncbi:MAG: hypothetical protein C4540_02515 [Candidatus Omnitrophota bacterium]|jgi:hypothetical protein|nr:MAG: hypothetical protein C4540_02515 [Candidatus Omnitrophota bacterium]